MKLIKYRNAGTHRVEQYQDNIYGVPVYPVYIDGHISPMKFDEAVGYLQKQEDLKK